MTGHRFGWVTAAALVVLVVMTASCNSNDGATAPADLPETGPTASASVDPATPTPRPTITPTPNPFEVSTTDGVVTIRRLSSPLPNTARAEGDMTIDSLTAPVTSDGEPAGMIQLTASPEGTFVVDIVGLSPGPQLLCIADACQRVFIAEASLESPEMIAQRIDEAIAVASTHFDIARYLPEWTIEIGGQNSGTGGTARLDTQQLFINANPARTLDDYVVTVLHEVGHAVDADYLDDTARERFRELRGHDTELAWGITDDIAVGANRWRNSAEDFAEVFVAWSLDGYQIESLAVASQPTAAELIEFCELIDLPEVACG